MLLPGLITAGFWKGILLFLPVQNSEGYSFSIEFVLLSVIGCIVFVSLLFFFMTLSKRLSRIKEGKKKEFYQKKIDEHFFIFLFEDKTVKEVIESNDFQEHKDKRLFQQLAIKALIALHRNYSGIYNKKLEEFYAESGLADYSMRKLNSENWSHIVEGIRDLSSLNYMPAHPRIVTYKNHRNSFVQTEVLLALIKLKGISEVLKFKNSEVFFNDWVQSNILFVVKNHKIPAPENLVELLESKNKTLVLLAVRLINYYGLPDQYHYLSGFYERTADPVLKKEIALLLDKTQQLQ